MTKFQSVQAYFSALPEPSRRALEKIREIVLKAAPGVEEKISYNLPAYHLHGPLIYLSAWKEHISIYPRTKGIEITFGEELSEYMSGKGTLQFSFERPVPYELIERIVVFRAKENLEKVKKQKEKH